MTKDGPLKRKALDFHIEPGRYAGISPDWFVQESTFQLHFASYQRELPLFDLLFFDSFGQVWIQ